MYVFGILCSLLSCVHVHAMTRGVLYKTTDDHPEEDILWDTYLWMERQPSRRYLCEGNVCAPLECRLYKLPAAREAYWPQRDYKRVGAEKLRKLRRWCDWDGGDDGGSESSDRKTFLGGLRQRASSLLIYPGTKWCGVGNVANGFDDLGANAGVDACCRAHDMCPLFIRSGSCVENAMAAEAAQRRICNKSSVTLLHCDCDAVFQACLRSIGTSTAAMLERIFFGLLDGQCFVTTPPYGAIQVMRPQWRQSTQVGLGQLMKDAIASFYK